MSLLKDELAIIQASIRTLLEGYKTAKRDQGPLKDIKSLDELSLLFKEYRAILTLTSELQVILGKDKAQVGRTLGKVRQAEAKSTTKEPRISNAEVMKKLMELEIKLDKSS